MVLSDLYNGWDDVTSFAFPCFLFRFLLCFLMRWLRPPCMYLSSPFPRTRNRLETVEASATGCVHTDGARPKPCSARTRWPKLACALAPRTAAAPHNGAAALEAGPARHDARATLPHAGAGARIPCGRRSIMPHARSALCANPSDIPSSHRSSSIPSNRRAPRPADTAGDLFHALPQPLPLRAATLRCPRCLLGRRTTSCSLSVSLSSPVPWKSRHAQEPGGRAGTTATHAGGGAAAGLSRALLTRKPLMAASCSVMSRSVS